MRHALQRCNQRIKIKICIQFELRILPLKSMPHKLYKIDFNINKQLLIHVKQQKSESESHVGLFVTPWTIQYMEFSRSEYWRGQPFPSPGDLPKPGNEPRFPTFQADSLPTELQVKPKNTGVGSLSLLQQIFLTQESNQGLLHCRQFFLIFLTN